MARKTIFKKSFSLSGNQAREFLAAVMSDEQIGEQLENTHLAPEMRQAIVAEASKRGLVPGNYEI